MDNIFQKRINCWNHTLSITKHLPSPPPSIKLTYDNDFVYEKKYPKSNIVFFDMDSIDCCLIYAPNALILNLADENFPGGCVSNGSGAQEESLFRRTNYHASLKIELYPLANDEVVYSPQISLIKTSESDGWKLLDPNKLNKISFIACPGIRQPSVININGEQRLNDNDVQILKNKIKTIIQTAVKFDHKTVILSALGCGAFRNPIKHVAEIFKSVLTEYDGVVLNYYFAIMTTSNNNYIVKTYSTETKKTIDIFKEVFGHSY